MEIITLNCDIMRVFEAQRARVPLDNTWIYPVFETFLIAILKGESVFIALQLCIVLRMHDRTLIVFVGFDFDVAVVKQVEIMVLLICESKGHINRIVELAEVYRISQ